jgi:hypothetical protein
MLQTSRQQESVMHGCTFTSLPAEAIAHALTFLGAADIERLGRTYNHFLTPICIASLKLAQAASIANARKMIGMFDLPEHYDRWPGVNHIWRKACGSGFTDYDFRASLREAYGKARLEQVYGPFQQRSISPERQHLNVSYLDLCGDLRWLFRRGPSQNALDASASVPVFEPNETWMGNLEILRKHVDEIGLTLPPGYQTLMTNLYLMEMIPSSTSCFWTVGSLIHVIDPTREWTDPFGQSHPVDGYITEVYSDQQGW